MPDDEIVSGKAREGQTEDDVVRSLSADVAFAKLGNDTRLEILHVLFQSDSPLNFSDVMNAVGVQDSGRFNYHLDKLLEIFVRHTSDGYELTRAGTTVIGGVLAGEYTKSFDTSPVSLETPCPSCDCSLTGEFTNDYVQIGCQSCGRILIKLEVPPGAFEAYPRKEWPHYVDQMARQEFSMLDAGFCTVCRGPISSHIDLNQIFFLKSSKLLSITNATAALLMFMRTLNCVSYHTRHSPPFITTMGRI